MTDGKDSNFNLFINFIVLFSTSPASCNSNSVSLLSATTHGNKTQILHQEQKLRDILMVMQHMVQTHKTAISMAAISAR